jgi:hypothetical protein
MPAPWKKWLTIGVSCGVTVVLVGAGLVAAVVWHDSRPRPWRVDALTAQGGEIRVVASHISPVPCDPAAKAAEICGDVESLTGFRLSYTLKNNTDRDITLSPSSVVKTRASNGVLDDPRVPIRLLTTFIPARQRVQVHLGIHYPIAEDKQALKFALGQVGLEQNVVGEFLLQDPVQRLEIRLPKPSPLRGLVAWVENP